MARDSGLDQVDVQHSMIGHFLTNFHRTSNLSLRPRRTNISPKETAGLRIERLFDLSEGVHEPKSDVDREYTDV